MPKCDIICNVDGALAQLVAHNTGSVGVRSSNLLCSTNKKTLESKDLRVFFCVLKMILVFYHRIVIGPFLEKQ